MNEQNSVAMPATIEDAVQLVKVIPVTGETFLSWLRALAVIPTQYGADLYVSMKQELAVAIERAATANAANEA
jgi:hypothetical protein